MSEKVKKLRPTEDFAFKRLFGREDSKRSLLSLLNAILDGNPVIKDLTILNTETQIEDRNNKASRLDIEVKANNDTFVNVEIQCIDTGDLYSRSIFYASSLIVQHSQKTKSYNEPYVISIWIIKDRIKDRIKDGIMTNRISPIEEIVNCTLPTRWGESFAPFSNKFRIIWVQLNKFKKNDELKDKISKGLKDWIEFFYDPNKIESDDEGIRDAQNLWNKISADEQLKAQQIARAKYEHDRNSEIATARNKGKEEGLAEGLEKGKEEGKLQNQKQIALNMKNKCFDNDTIAQCLNISIEELQQLLNN